MPELKYKARLQQILKDVYYCPEMTAQEWEDLENEMMDNGAKYERLNHLIDLGVRLYHLSAEWYLETFRKGLIGND